MAFEKILKTLSGDGPGRSTEITYFRIGPKHPSQKVYLQAALHADEQPGILVLHHLLAMLKLADENKQLNAEFVVFPMVNPLGMAQISCRQHQGRYDEMSGVNFNRDWPDLYQVVQTQSQKDLCGPLADELTDSLQHNTSLIRGLIKNWLRQLEPIEALQQQRHVVMNEAYDADYVLDLHCDHDSLLHIFALPQHMTVLQGLADWTGAAAVLNAEDSGGGPFDETWSTLWTRLQKDYPDKPLAECYSATVEYRGQFDTFDELNLSDAERLFAYFQSRDLISGVPGNPPGTSVEPTDLAATEMLRVNQAGLLAYKVALGDIVTKGQIVAELLTIDGPQAFEMRIPVRASTDGLILSRTMNKYVWPGLCIAKVVGKDILAANNGSLLDH